MERRQPRTDQQLHARRFLLAALFCVTALAGCGPEPQGSVGAGGSAQINLKVTMPRQVAVVSSPSTSLWGKVQRWVFGQEAWAASVNEITALVVRVTGPGIEVPVASPAVPVTGAVSGLVIPVTLEVPVGADRVFVVAAVDAANRPIFQGQSAPVTLVADQPANVAIQLSDTTIRITTTTLPDGTESQAYTAALGVERSTGGTWTIQEGVLPPGVNLNAATGVLTGTSNATGFFPVRIRVTDAIGLFDEVPLTIRINPVPIPPTIITTTLPNGTVGAPYITTLVATGGTGAPRWSVVTGTGKLPDGLQLIEATGVISGTPTTAGTTTVTVRATDTTPLSDEQVLTLTINPAPVPPSITTTVLPDGTTGAEYNTQLTATGGTGKLTWRVVAGALPDGLRLTDDGAITDKPTKNGTFTFTVRATDTMLLSAEKVLSITIKEAPKPPVITSTTLPGGQVGDAYNAQLTATSTNGAVTWSLVSTGDPAPGLKLQGATISGTPSTKGTFEFTVRATDGKGLIDEQALFIQINDKPKPPIITTTTLPGGTVNVVYQAQLTVTNTNGAVKWSVIPSGNPAPGLLLDGTTGVITGTPTTKGVFSFTVRATDSSTLSSEKALTITIQDPILPPVITTDSLPEGKIGAEYKTKLTATSTNGAVTWSATPLPDGLALNPTSGDITGTPKVAGRFDVTVRATDEKSQVDQQALSLRIRARAPVISTRSLPDGIVEFDDGESVVGRSYNATLKATGGEGTITWSISTRNLSETGLPPGLVLSPSGEITGAPTETGTSTFTVRATDTVGQSDSRQLSITVTFPLTITTGELPVGFAGVPYNAIFNGEFLISKDFQLGARGGVKDYTWELVSGTLPSGLTLSSGGLISGTPRGGDCLSEGTFTDNFTVTFQVKDDRGTVVRETFRLAITTQCLF